MSKAKILNELKPKSRKYIIVKEMFAVSISDALRKERSGQIIRVQEVEKDHDEEDEE